MDRIFCLHLVCIICLFASEQRGGHINPAVTFGLFLARKLSLTRALSYIVMQCLGAICGAGVVKGFQPKQYQALGGGANIAAHGYTKGSGLGAEIIGTFVLVYTVFSATDAKRNARDSHVPTSHTQNRLCLKINSLAIRVCKLLRSSPTSPLGGVVIDKLLKMCWKDAKAS